CFPLQETWYMMYRSHEIDPGFGGKAKCVKGYQTGPLVDGSAPILYCYFVSIFTKTNFTSISCAFFFCYFANQSVWDFIIRVRYNSTVHIFKVL
ncbi:hypothetical protein IscW_ISCW013442, partial [Ixodes scapularis]